MKNSFKGTSFLGMSRERLTHSLQTPMTSTASVKPLITTSSCSPSIWIRMIPMLKDQFSNIHSIQFKASLPRDSTLEDRQEKRRSI